MIKSKSIIICEDDKTAIDFYNIYSAQFPYQKILYFPAHDSLPFSLESSSSDILLERSLKFIDLDKSEIIILTCNCFLKLFDLKTEVDHFLQIKINQKLDVNNLIKTLVNFGHSNNLFPHQPWLSQLVTQKTKPLNLTLESLPHNSVDKKYLHC